MNILKNSRHMKKKTLDSLDNEIILLLTADGRMPIGDMAARLNVTAPTIRSRIKNLEESGMLKVSGIIDPNQHPQMITALVAMSIRSHGKMDQILKNLLSCRMLSGQEWLPDATILSQRLFV
jgi:Lrp/AsnC family transcriptional regulator for asnA, asnC and gidA